MPRCATPRQLCYVASMPGGACWFTVWIAHVHTSYKVMPCSGSMSKTYIGPGIQA